MIDLLHLSTADPEDGDGFAEVLNEKALSVVDRISKKLTGRDFSNSTLSVTEQVRAGFCARWRVCAPARMYVCV